VRLVFKAIHTATSEKGDDSPMPEDFTIDYAKFFQFFASGHRLKSGLHSPVGASTLMPTYEGRSLDVVREDYDEKDPGGSLSASPPSFDTGMTVEEGQRVATVKKSILECLNLGGDFGMLKGFIAATDGAKPSSKRKKSTAVKIGDQMIDAAKFNVTKAMDKLHKIEVLIPIMQANVFKCTDSEEFQKWNNRFLSHKERFANLTMILNKVMHLQVKTLQRKQSQMQTDLKKMEKERSYGGLSPSVRGSPSMRGLRGSLSTARKGSSTAARGKDSPGSVRSVHDEMVSFSAQHTVALRKSRSTRVASHSRGSSFGMLASGALEADDDTQSVDSEAELVYTEESEAISQRMAHFRHEAKRLARELSDLQSEMKVQEAKYEGKVTKLERQCEKLEADKDELEEKSKRVKERMRKIKKTSTKDSDSAAISQSAEVQRATMSLRRELMNMRKELDKEREAKTNLQARLKRALDASKKSKDKGGGDAISTRRMEKLRKELDMKDAEVKLKQKRLDEMFLKVKDFEQRVKASEKKESKLKDKMAELEKQLNDAKIALKGVKSSEGELEALEKEIEKLRKKVEKQAARLAKSKVRNEKLKAKLEALRERLKEFSRLREEIDAMRTELDSLLDEKSQLSSELVDAGGKNADLEKRLAALDKAISEKRDQYKKTDLELRSFKDALDEEQRLILELQESLEDRDQMIADKDDEIADRLAKLEAALVKKDSAIAKYKAQTKTLGDENAA
jgi:predicted  nucleic acid-binding Zn-ribbon protein